MKRIIAALIFSLVVLTALLSEQQPKTPPEVSEVSKLKLLNSYKTVLLRQDAFQSSVSAYQAEAAAVVKAEKLPEGTGFKVNSDTNTVEVVLPPEPPKPEPAKPETKKPEPAKGK